MADSELSKLKRKLKEQTEKIVDLEETLRAIQSGEVDALVVHGPQGERIFTLQSAEQPYRELVEAINEGALTVSLSGTILYCNAKFESMVKLNAGKIIGTDLRAHVNPRNRLAVDNLLSESKFVPSTAEVWLTTEGEAPLPVQLSVASIELVGTEGFCIIATDLSAQKQSALSNQQQEWLGKLLDSLPVPLVLLDSTLEEMWFVNAKAHEVLNCDTSSGESKVANEFLMFETDSGDPIPIFELVEKACGEALGIEVILNQGESKVPVLVFCETLPAMHEKGPAKLLMFQDVSSLKKVQKELTAAVKGRDQFMAALSHELRTPLNVILGWVQLLRANLNDPKLVTQALDTLDRNGELQRVLIEDLLDMSRIITGNLVLDTKPLDLKSTVREGLVSLQLRAKEKEIVLVADLASEPTVILGDQKRIQQLVSNLVQNSIKFTPPQGRITVSVRTSIFEKLATVTVTDTGQGIEPSFLANVFDQFKQESMSINRPYGGLGLGLAICKSITEEHQGRITVSSEGRGKGATFTVKLPLSNFMIKRVASKAVADKELLSLAGIRVLVVDDSTDNLQLFSVWLKKAGAEIKTLSSPAGVVGAIESFRPHVLLSDISMPGEDGYDLIAKVRALSVAMGGAVPAGALTANARAEDRDQTLAAGFQLHIPKPITSGGLIEAVKSLYNLGLNTH